MKKNKQNGTIQLIIQVPRSQIDLKKDVIYIRFKDEILAVVC